MSHQPERKEKDCLNCGATVVGRYCHACGQENLVAHQGFWSLLRHFVYDVFHYDGKFIDTFKYLITRPGFVPKQYLQGKRQSYLDPIRMYLFTSAVFFLIFFAIKKPEDGVQILGNNEIMSRKERAEYATRLTSILNTRQDSILVRQLYLMLDTTYRIHLKKDSSIPKTDTTFPVLVGKSKYTLLAQKIPPAVDNSKEKTSWIGRQLKETWKKITRKYGDDEYLIMTKASDSFMHKFPYILFLSLPFFALILKLLYIRRANFYYSDHAVFTLYHYIFMFILLLFYFLFDSLEDWTGYSVFKTVKVLTILSALLYLYISMKRFYGQKWFKTLVKFFMLNFLAITVLTILMLIFILLSFFQL